MKIVHHRKRTEEIFKPAFRSRIKLKPLPDRCSGCLYCELICHYTKEGEFGTSAARLRVERISMERLYGERIKKKVKDEPIFKPVVCNLCGECVKVCPTGALYFSEQKGYLQFDESKCDECELCVNFCSNKVLKFHKGKLIFCDACEGSPQCIKWCPREAIAINSVRD